MEKALILLIAMSCATCTAAHAAPSVTFGPVPAQALASHLAKQGNICVGKTEWPIAVSEQDVAAGGRDAVQLPVLEKLGLVVSSVTHKVGEIEETVAVTRYALTDLGKKYFRPKPVMSPPNEAPEAPQEAPENDFCVGTLSLDKVVEWNEIARADGRREAMASYTYKIAAPDWAGNTMASSL